MIDTLMALWNRDSYSRGILLLTALLGICISISLLFVTVNNSVAGWLHQPGTPNNQGGTSKILPTSTPTSGLRASVTPTLSAVPSPTRVITPVPTRGGNGSGNGGSQTCPTPSVTVPALSQTPTSPPVTPSPEVSPTSTPEVTAVPPVPPTPTPTATPTATATPDQVTPVPPTVTATPDDGTPDIDVSPTPLVKMRQHGSGVQPMVTPIATATSHPTKASPTVTPEPTATPSSVVKIQRARNVACQTDRAETAAPELFKTTLILLGGVPAFGMLGFLALIALLRRRNPEK